MRLRSIVRGMVRPMGASNYLIPVDVKTTETGELLDQSLRLTEITRKLKVEAENATHFVVFAACRNRLRLTQAGSPGPSCARKDPFRLSKRTTCSSHTRSQRVSLHRMWARALVATPSVSFICWWDKLELDAFARVFRPVAEEGH